MLVHLNERDNSATNVSRRDSRRSRSRRPTVSNHFAFDSFIQVLRYTQLVLPQMSSGPIERSQSPLSSSSTGSSHAPFSFAFDHHQPPPSQPNSISSSNQSNHLISNDNLLDLILTHKKQQLLRSPQVLQFIQRQVHQKKSNSVDNLN